MEQVEKLIVEAFSSRKKAYAPYSKYKVGAALLTEDDKIYGGFNIENAAYSVCNCAERTALFRAIYDGYKKFKAIVIVGGSENEEEVLSSFAPPCGMCRQALREFCQPENFKIILARSKNDFKIFTLSEFLPESFGPNNLN